MFKNSLFLLLFLGGIEFYGHLNLQEAPLARLVAVYLFVSQITLCLPFPNDLPVYPKPFPFVLLLFLFCEIPTGVRVEVQRCSFGSMYVNQGISRLHQLVHKQRPVAVNRYILMCLHAVASDLVFFCGDCQRGSCPGGDVRHQAGLSPRRRETAHADLTHPQRSLLFPRSVDGRHSPVLFVLFTSSQEYGVPLRPVLCMHRYIFAPIHTAASSFPHTPRPRHGRLAQSGRATRLFRCPHRLSGDFFLPLSQAKSWYVDSSLSDTCFSAGPDVVLLVAKAASLAPWFPPHLQRDIYLSLLHLDPPASSSKEKKAPAVPETVLKAALLRRATEDINRVMMIRNQKPALAMLLQRGSVGDDLWQRFLRAEKEMEDEVRDVVAEVGLLPPPFLMFASSRLNCPETLTMLSTNLGKRLRA